MLEDQNSAGVVAGEGEFLLKEVDVSRLLLPQLDSHLLLTLLYLLEQNLGYLGIYQL